MTPNKIKAVYNSNAIVTIEEARAVIEAIIGTACPKRHMFHHAIKRGELKTLAGPGDREAKLRLGDAVDLYKRTGLKGPRGSHGKPTVEAADVPPAGTDADAAPATAWEVADADSTTTSTLHLLEPVCSNAGSDTEIVVGDVQSAIAEVETMLAGVADLTEADLMGSIKNYAGRAEALAGRAVATSKQAMICAWATGVLLNKAKQDCGHGNFGKWSEEHLQSLGLSQRSGQRYMKLAKTCPDVRSLVANHPGLKEAYVTCNIIQERSAEADAANKGDDGGQPDTTACEGPRQAKALLGRLSSLQGCLRRFTSSGECLDADQINEVKLVKASTDTQTQTAA